MGLGKTAEFFWLQDVLKRFSWIHKRNPDICNSGKLILDLQFANYKLLIQTLNIYSFNTWQELKLHLINIDLLPYQYLNNFLDNSHTLICQLVYISYGNSSLFNAYFHYLMRANHDHTLCIVNQQYLD